MFNDEKPISWLGKPHPLKNPCSPVPDGQEIFLTELQGEKGMSTRDGRISNFTNSQFTKTYITNQECFEDDILCAILTKTILGGYLPESVFPDVPKIVPMAYSPNGGIFAFAKDIGNIFPFQPNKVIDGESELTYTLCRLTVGFETLPYPVDLDFSADGDYNPNFMLWEESSTSTKVSISTGWYSFQAGVFNAKPAMLGMYLNAPLTYHTVTIFHVRDTELFGLDTTNKLNIVSPNFGKVNAAPFAGMSAEKLMLDSAEFQIWKDWLDQTYYNVRLHLVYNDWGWNKLPTPNGTVETVGYVLTGSKPWPTFDMRSMFLNLNPI